MSRVNQEGNLLHFWCPACDMRHTVEYGTNATWTWNGDVDKPTFKPSLIWSTGHYAYDEPREKCWCTFNIEHKDDPRYKHLKLKCVKCHSFITDGRIQFLDDCSHELKGQTLDIPMWPKKTRVDMKIYIERNTSISSEASEKAKTMGLKHLGFGRYTGPKGERYATRDGKLHRMDDHGDTGKPVPEDDDEGAEGNEEEELVLYNKDGERVDAEGNVIEKEEEEEEEEESALYNKDGERVNADGTPYEESEEDDAEDEESEEDDAEEEPEPTPEHHLNLEDASRAPEGTNEPVSAEQQHAMRNDLSASNDEVYVGDDKVKLKRTRQLVDDIKGAFGRTVDGYKGTTKELADNVKGYRPFAEDKSNWEIGDDGIPYDPEADEKAANRKKVVAEIGIAVLASIGFLLLGPVAATVTAVVAITIANGYDAKIDEDLKKKQDKDRGDTKKDKKNTNDEDEVPAESKEEKARLKEREKKEEQLRRQREAQDEASHNAKGRIVRPGTYQFKKVRNKWVREKRRPGTPILQGNEGYVFVINDRNEWDRYSEDEFKKLNKSNSMSLSGTSDAEFDVNLSTVIDDYKTYIKTLDLKTLYQKAQESMNPEDLLPLLEFKPKPDEDESDESDDDEVDDESNDEDADEGEVNED